MLRRTSVSFAAQLFALAVSFADRILLVGILLRAWGTDVYSDWATLVAAASLVSLGELGLNVYFGNGWQVAFARRNELQFQRLIGVSVCVYSGLGATLAACVVIYALNVDVTAALSLKAVTASEGTIVFLILAVAAVLRVMRGSVSQIYRGRGRYAVGTLIVAAANAAAILLAAFGAWMGAGVIAVASLYVVAELCFGWGAILIDLRRRFPDISIRPARPNASELRHLFSNVGWYGVLQGAPVIWLSAPVLILGALGYSGRALVSFVIARTLVNFARQFTTMLLIASGIEVAMTVHAGDRATLDRQIASVGRGTAAITGAVAGAVIVFAAPVIAAWTGNPELYHPVVLLWLLLPVPIVVPALPLAAILTYSNRPKPEAFAKLAQVPLGVVLCSALAMEYGTIGVPAGLAAAEIICLGLLLPALAARPLAVNYGSYFARSTAVFALTATLGLAVGWGALHLFGGGSVERLAASAILWAGVSLPLSLSVALSKEQGARVLSRLRSQIVASASGWRWRLATRRSPLGRSG